MHHGRAGGSRSASLARGRGRRWWLRRCTGQRAIAIATADDSSPPLPLIMTQCTVNDDQRDALRIRQLQAAAALAAALAPKVDVVLRAESLSLSLSSLVLELEIAAVPLLPAAVLQTTLSALPPSLPAASAETRSAGVGGGDDGMMFSHARR